MNLELFRRGLRPILGYRSPAYTSAAFLLAQYEILRREGWRTMRELRKLQEQRGREVTLHLRSLRYPIVVRAGTEDLPSVINNAIRQEYGQFGVKYAPKVIVDAGAYIGDTSAYFLSRFPAARVIALEPNEDSYQFALRNLRPYGNRVCLIKAALWSEMTTVQMSGSQTAAAIAAAGSAVPAETVASLMSRHGVGFIDLLKLDIEGAEAQVIPSGVGSWLDRVGTVLLETHGSSIEVEVVPMLVDAGFTYKRFRSIWYFTRR